MKLNERQVSTIVITLVLVLVFALTQCIQNKDNKQESTTTTTTTTTTTSQNVQEPPALLDGKEVMKYQKDGNKITIDLTLTDEAGSIVSLIALSNTEDRFNWSDQGKNSLCDLTEVKLDKEGKGAATLVLSSQSEKVFVILTAPNSSYVIEIV